MIRCTGPIFISGGNRLRRYYEVSKTRPGTIKNILMVDIRADVKQAEGGLYQGRPWGNAEGGVVISGLWDYPAENITLRNCDFAMPGGREAYQKQAVPEMGEQYPEFHLFDPLPSWGAYLRHGRNIKLEDCRFTASQKDVRPAVVREDIIP